jgi:hypothetical protein
LYLLDDFNNEAGGLAGVELTNETLRDLARAAGIVQTETTNVRVSA